MVLQLYSSRSAHYGKAMYTNVWASGGVPGTKFSTCTKFSALPVAIKFK